MVIDASSAIRQVVKNMLIEIGFDVTEAKDSTSALDRLTTFPDVDLVVCDWETVEANGIEFLEALRSDHALSHVRVVVAARVRDESQLAEALRAGADDWVLKPFTKDVLVEALSRMEIGL